VIARVNGHDIPLRHAVMIAERLMGEGFVTPDRKAAAYRAAMEQLIARELLFEEAVARRNTPDARAVERAHDQVRAQHKTEEDWKKFLKLQGLDEQAFKTELRTRHTIEALLKAETDRVPSDVPEAELKAYYDQHAAEFQLGERVKASHILVEVPAPGDAAAKASARAAAEKLLARVRKGEDFAALAMENSKDPGSAPQGGMLPPFGRGEMVPPFEEAAFALKPGEVSTVVETQFGYHVIMVHERLAPVKEPFETVRDRIREEVVMARRQSAVNALLVGLRARAVVETFL
jgi:peptidyl-prolyl cis-trans isomerase C